MADKTRELFSKYNGAPKRPSVTALSDVFRADKAVEGWVKTSVSLRAETKTRLKAFAVEHDMRIQEVIDEALTAYMN